MSFTVLAATMLLSLSAASNRPLPLQDDPRHALISVERIWDRAQHNAFTDLARSHGRLYCTFREGKGEPPQSNAVSHGCSPSRFRSINVINTGRQG